MTSSINDMSRVFIISPLRREDNGAIMQCSLAELISLEVEAVVFCKF